MKLSTPKYESGTTEVILTEAEFRKVILFTHSAIDIGYTDDSDKEFIESVEAVNKALQPEYIPFRSEPKLRWKDWF